ncbi:MAG: CrcB family protein [Cyanobacteria bacterium J06638_7]
MAPRRRPGTLELRGRAGGLVTPGPSADALLIAIGAVPAAWLRFRVVDHLQPMLPGRHWGTFGVNVVACFALGPMVALEQGCGESSRRRRLGTGLGELQHALQLHRRMARAAPAEGLGLCRPAGRRFGAGWPAGGGRRAVGGHGAMNAPSRSRLRAEARDLTLVGAGTNPGALTRWGFEVLGERLSGGLQGLIEANFAANMLGRLLMGPVLALPPRRWRTFLWAGIGFCGSHTTFSTRMLQLSVSLQRGHPGGSVAVLLGTLLGGLLLLSLSFRLTRRLQAGRPAPPCPPPG